MGRRHGTCCSSKCDARAQDSVSWTLKAQTFCFSSVVSVYACTHTHTHTEQALFTTGMWAGALPAILDPNNHLGTTGRSGGIHNLNLYFMSWAALITSYFILYGYVLDHVARDRGMRHDESLWMWAGVIFCSFVVMVVGSRLYHNGACDDDSTEVCLRVKYAFSMGSVSALISMSWLAAAMFIKTAPTVWLDAVTVLILVVLWCIGITFTFDERQVPPVTNGSMYLFMWGGWTLLVFITMKHVDAVWNKVMTRTCVEETVNTGTVEKGNVESEAVEEMDVETHATHDEKHAEAEPEAEA
jgi:hypothetical protein